MTPAPQWSREVHGAVVLAGILAAIVCVPVPLGSNRPWAWFGLELVVYGTVAFWAVGGIFCGGHGSLHRSVARIVAVLLAWLGLVLLQTMPMPENLIASLNPFVHAQQQNLRLISVESRGSLSIDPGNSYNEFLKYGAYVAVFSLILITVTTRRRLLYLTGTIVAAGVLESIFGLYTQLTGFVIFPETGSSGELRAGTFVNRHHYANLVAMTLGVVVGMLACTGAPRRKETRGTNGGGGVSLTQPAVLAGVVAIMAAAMIAAGSAAAIVFFSVSIAIVLVVARAVPATSTGDSAPPIPVILLAAALVAVLVGYEGTLMRLLDGELLRSERILQNLSGFSLLSTVWAAGVGAGNYRWVFPSFRGDELRFVTYDYAHNDYLQTAIEQGLPVAAVLALAVGLIVRELYRGYKNRRDPLLRGVILGCLTSVIFMLLHALVEFNFRIPANAVYFFSISALGIAACRLDRGRSRSRATPSDSESV